MLFLGLGSRIDHTQIRRISSSLLDFLCNFLATFLFPLFVVFEVDFCSFPSLPLFLSSLLPFLDFRGLKRPIITDLLVLRKPKISTSFPDDDAHENGTKCTLGWCATVGSLFRNITWLFWRDFGFFHSWVSFSDPRRKTLPTSLSPSFLSVFSLLQVFWECWVENVILRSPWKLTDFLATLYLFTYSYLLHSQFSNLNTFCQQRCWTLCSVYLLQTHIIFFH